MKILAVESSCDETAAAVIGDEAVILSNVVVSQVDIFAAYGGVIPEVAARSHLEAILPVIHKALDDAHVTRDEIDYIAVTYAPGLLGSLLIGTLTARMLAILWNKPLLPVHHLKSHIYACWLLDSSSSAITSSNSPVRSRRISNTSPLRASSLPSTSSKITSSKSPTVPQFPLLSLVISGGHTQIIYMPAHNQFEIIGTTRDDAVGECFDKVAKILGLPYPGGPSIAKAALSSQLAAMSKVEQDKWYTEHPNYKLPHPKIDGLDFSFSGLKTAVLRAVQAECGLPITTPSFELAAQLSEVQRADFAFAFQDTACEILLEKLQLALTSHPKARSAVFAGGVSANQVLRQKAQDGRFGGSQGHISKADESAKAQSQPNSAQPEPNPINVEVYFPQPKYTGDNAAMVGAAAYYEILSGVKPTDPYHLDILPRTPIH